MRGLEVALLARKRGYLLFLLMIVVEEGSATTPQIRTESVEINLFQKERNTDLSIKKTISYA
jgi:hypothetical protein